MLTLGTRSVAGSVAFGTRSVAGSVAGSVAFGTPSVGVERLSRPPASLLIQLYRRRKYIAHRFKRCQLSNSILYGIYLV